MSATNIKDMIGAKGLKGAGNSQLITKGTAKRATMVNGKPQVMKSGAKNSAMRKKIRQQKIKNAQNKYNNARKSYYGL